LAEAIFSGFLHSTKAAGDWIISSAGTWAQPGFPPLNEAMEDAKRMKLDISRHRSQQISARLLSQNNLILVMEAGQKEALQIEFPQYKEKVYMLSEIVEDAPYDIPDPVSSGEVTHQEIANELFELIKRGYNNICNMALTAQKSQLKHS
jgi:protein-tyrosine-phosphatase